MFWSAGCSLARAEGFNCIFDVLWRLEISKLQFLIKKIWFFFSCKNLTNFGHQNKNWVRIRIDLKCRIRIETNADPQHWVEQSATVIINNLAAFPLLFSKPNIHLVARFKQVFASNWKQRSIIKNFSLQNLSANNLSYTAVPLLFLKYR
jgi:hypothetical protein